MALLKELAENWRPRMAASEIANPNVVGPSVGLLWRDLKDSNGSIAGLCSGSIKVSFRYRFSPAGHQGWPG
jgi:hypothetical protein